MRFRAADWCFRAWWLADVSAMSTLASGLAILLHSSTSYNSDLPSLFNALKEAYDLGDRYFRE
jgi:hypothetical protein